MKLVRAYWWTILIHNTNNVFSIQFMVCLCRLLCVILAYQLSWSQKYIYLRSNKNLLRNECAYTINGNTYRYDNRNESAVENVTWRFFFLRNTFLRTHQFKRKKNKLKVIQLVREKTKSWKCLNKFGCWFFFSLKNCWRIEFKKKMFVLLTKKISFICNQRYETCDTKSDKDPQLYPKIKIIVNTFEIKCI